MKKAKNSIKKILNKINKLEQHNEIIEILPYIKEITDIIYLYYSAQLKKVDAMRDAEIANASKIAINKKIEDLEPETNTLNRLKQNDIITIGDLLQCCEYDLCKIEGLGNVGRRRLIDLLKANNLYLKDYLYKKGE